MEGSSASIFIKSSMKNININVNYAYKNNVSYMTKFNVYKTNMYMRTGLCQLSMRNLIFSIWNMHTKISTN